MRYRHQRDWLRLVSQGAEDVVALCKRNVTSEKTLGKRFFHMGRFCTAAGESVTVRALYAVLSLRGYVRTAHRVRHGGWFYF